MQRWTPTLSGLIAIAMTGAGCLDTTTSPSASSSPSAVADRDIVSTYSTPWARTLPAFLATQRLYDALPRASELGIATIEDHRRRRFAPVPIPGGIQIPNGPLLHVFIPGPTSIPMAMGEDVEPSVITNMHGFTAMAYLAGRATDQDGHVYDMSNDIRIYRGKFCTADGHCQEGTFGFI